jgi:hypothetical protein
MRPRNYDEHEHPSIFGGIGGQDRRVVRLSQERGRLATFKAAMMISSLSSRYQGTAT